MADNVNSYATDSASGNADPEVDPADPADPAEPGESIRFTVLGPVRAWRGDVEIDCGPPTQRKVLALLLVAGGQPVSMSQLIDLLWEHTPPASAANTVQRSIGTLRRQFEPDLPMRKRGQWLVRQQSNYLVNVGPETLDLLRFRQLSAAGSSRLAAGNPAQALPTFLAALDLWQGPCASGIELTSRAQPTFVGIDRERVLVAQEAAEAARGAGRPQDVLSVMRQLAPAYPTDEGLHAELVLCLAAAGYQAEALAVHTAVSKALVDQIGVQPGQALRAAQQRVLHQQAKSTVARPSVEPAPVPFIAERVVRPAQLPPDLRVFVGRDDELARLKQSLVPDDTAVSITGISGMAGVGKTTLAVHWAHELADQYPDGQLYVNLRGFDQNCAVLNPDRALNGFLHVLGVAPGNIPEDTGEAAALYRSLLFGKRVLVLLDNARDVSQVRPLLAATPGCLVIVTSRRPLVGLAASHGAHLVELHPFSSDEARETLARRIGPNRLAAEPGAVAEVIDACGGLPLAIAVVAARAVVNDRLSISAIAAELRDERTRLDALDASDAAVDVRMVFSWSYQMLSPEAAALFRLLPLSPGQEMSARALAALVGCALSELRPRIAALISAALITEPEPGRYSAHDLLRFYADELSTGHDMEEVRTDARIRLFDYYLHTLRSAENTMGSAWVRMALPEPVPGANPEQLTDRLYVSTWFERERLVLVNAVTQASGIPQLRTRCWQLALALQPYLHRHGYWHDWIVVMETAIGVAKILGDRIAESYCHRSLAGAYQNLGRNDLASIELEHTKELFIMLGHTEQNAYLEANFGWVRVEQRRYEEALQHFQRATDMFAESGDERERVLALLGLGQANTNLGEYDKAAEAIQAAIDLSRELDDTTGQAHGWERLASVEYAQHNLARAAEYFQRALTLHRQEKNPTCQADCLVALGEIELALGNEQVARELWTEARAIMDNLRLPQAEFVRERLAKLDS